MNHFFELLKILLPSVVVFLTAYYLFRIQLQSEKEKKVWEGKKSLQKETLILRLQAYERLLLLLERIKPLSIVMRLSNNNETALSFHRQVLATVRAEFEHNIAQQLYVSKEAWELVVSAKEEILKDLNLAKEKIKDDDSALFLVKLIITESDSQNKLVFSAIDFLKNEANTLF